MRTLAVSMFAANGKQTPAALLEAMGGEKVSSDDEELTPGIRSASEILDELQRAVAAVKGR